MVTLTGTFTRLDGDPATGTVKITPSRSPILDSTGKVIISGPQVFPLNKDGKLTTEIPASNDPDLGPAFTYAVDVNLTHASWKISKVWIPHGSVTVDLSEIGDYQPVPGVATRVVTIPADGEDGQVLVWDGAGFVWDFPPEGPEGPPGEVTTADLTTALAGKVTGTGMTVRVDNSVGTRVLLDHPGGTTMLYGDTGWRRIYAWDDTGTLTTGDTFPTGITPIPGQAGFIQIRRTTHTVYIDLHRVRASTNAAVALPSGFRPGGAGIKLALSGGTVQIRTSVIPAEGDYGTSGAPRQYSDQAIFAADSTYWPTTLPGLPL